MTWIHWLKLCDSGKHISFKDYKVFSISGTQWERKRKGMWGKCGWYLEISSNLGFSWGQLCETERFLSVKCHSLNSILPPNSSFSLISRWCTPEAYYRLILLCPLHTSLSLSPWSLHPPWVSGKPEELPLFTRIATEKPFMTRYPSRNQVDFCFVLFAIFFFDNKTHKAFFWVE